LLLPLKESHQPFTATYTLVFALFTSNETRWQKHNYLGHNKSLGISMLQTYFRGDVPDLTSSS